MPPVKPPKGSRESLLKRVRQKCFVVFKDERGVVYCERVNSHLIVMAKIIITDGGRHTDLVRTVVPYHDKPGEFWDKILACYENGYTVEPDRYYMEPNRWGPVQALKVIEDLRAGAALKAVLDKGTPEAMNLKDRDFNPRPVEPFTSHVLRTILDQGTESTPDMVAKYNGPPLKDMEIMWLQTHGADLDAFGIDKLKRKRYS